MIINNQFMLSERSSSYGCTQEVWRTRERRQSKLVSRVSHLPAPGGGKIRDPGNEVGVRVTRGTAKNNSSLSLRNCVTLWENSENCSVLKQNGLLNNTFKKSTLQINIYRCKEESSRLQSLS